MLQIINKRKYTYIVSIALIFVSAFALGKWGLKLGIDFQGGTLMEVEYSSKKVEQEVKFVDPSTGELEMGEKEGNSGEEIKIPSSQEVQDVLAEIELNSLIVQQSGDERFIIRYVESDEDTNEKVLGKIKELNETARQIRVDFIGASVSDQLAKNARLALIIAIIGIALYIAWAFRKVSYPVFHSRCRTKKPN